MSACLTGALGFGLCQGGSAAVAVRCPGADPYRGACPGRPACHPVQLAAGVCGVGDRLDGPRGAVPYFRQAPLVTGVGDVEPDGGDAPAETHDTADKLAPWVPGSAPGGTDHAVPFHRSISTDWLPEPFCQ